MAHAGKYQQVQHAHQPRCPKPPPPLDAALHCNHVSSWLQVTCNVTKGGHDGVTHVFLPSNVHRFGTSLSRRGRQRQRSVCVAGHRRSRSSSGHAGQQHGLVEALQRASEQHEQTVPSKDDADAAPADVTLRPSAAAAISQRPSVPDNVPAAGLKSGAIGQVPKGTIEATSAAAAAAAAEEAGAAQRQSARGHKPPAPAAHAGAAVPPGLARVLQRTHWVASTLHDPHNVLLKVAKSQLHSGQCTGDGSLQVVTFCDAWQAAHQAGALKQHGNSSAGTQGKHLRCTACSAGKMGTAEFVHKQDSPGESPGRKHAGQAAPAAHKPQTALGKQLLAAQRASKMPHVEVEITSRFDSQLGFVDGLYDEESDTLFVS